MSEETKKDDQTLASISFILGIVVVGLAVFFVNTFDMNSSKAKAMKRADVYAQKLIDKGFEVEIEQADESIVRGLASTAMDTKQVLQGPLGIDPWGYPFQYFVQKKPSALTGKMVVWSGGPDNNFQTTMEDIQNALTQSKNIRYAGDDFGKVINFKLDPRFANK